jgi:hypothetical protein
MKITLEDYLTWWQCYQASVRNTAITVSQMRWEEFDTFLETLLSLWKL